MNGAAFVILKQCVDYSFRCVAVTIGTCGGHHGVIRLAIDKQSLDLSYISIPVSSHQACGTGFNSLWPLRLISQ
jgi:hypothetical protein